MANRKKRSLLTKTNDRRKAKWMFLRIGIVIDSVHFSVRDDGLISVR